MLPSTPNKVQPVWSWLSSDLESEMEELSRWDAWLMFKRMRWSRRGWLIRKKKKLHSRISMSRVFKTLFTNPLCRLIGICVFHFLYASSTFLSSGDRTNQSDVFPSLCVVCLGQKMFTYFFWLKARFTKPIKWRFSKCLLLIQDFVHNVQTI